MRVYVASAFHRKADVKVMQQILREAGHEITRDWTGEDFSKIPEAQCEAYAVEQAQNDQWGVAASEAVVVLYDDAGRGMCVEIGLAIAYGIPIYVVASEGSGNIFLHLPLVRRCPTIAHALHALTEHRHAA